MFSRIPLCDPRPHIAVFVSSWFHIKQFADACLPSPTWKNERKHVLEYFMLHIGLIKLFGVGDDLINMCLFVSMYHRERSGERTILYRPGGKEALQCIFNMAKQQAGMTR